MGSLGLRERRRKLRRRNLLPTLSCLENVALPLHLRGWPRKKAEERARELLDTVKLGRARGTLAG